VQEWLQRSSQVLLVQVVPVVSVLEALAVQVALRAWAVVVARAPLVADMAALERFDFAVRLDLVRCLPN
jgi:hypothetical protein